ncbi:hypothetical protein ACIQU8_21510 [Streptomyces griseus]|uniref:hypothetical protein n=1 Tax=Streptomyces griseus TaxID=1911 RepID=UPI0037F967FD
MSVGSDGALAALLSLGDDLAVVAALSRRLTGRNGTPNAEHEDRRAVPETASGPGGGASVGAAVPPSTR